VTRQAAFDRGERGIGARPIRPTAPGEVRATDVVPFKLGDAALTSSTAASPGSAREDCANRSKRLQELDQVALLPSR
jgi:hypothetical protein